MSNRSVGLLDIKRISQRQIFSETETEVFYSTKTVYKLWNNFRKMFLNVKLQKRWTSNYLLYRLSSKHSDSARPTRPKINTRCLWSSSRANKNRHHFNGIRAWAQKHFHKSLSVDTTHNDLHVVAAIKFKITFLFFSWNLHFLSSNIWHLFLFYCE